LEYALVRYLEVRHLGWKGIDVPVAVYELRSQRPESKLRVRGLGLLLFNRLVVLVVPRRANLHYCLTKTFFNSDFRTETLEVSLDKQDFERLQLVFRHQGNYSFWREWKKSIQEGKGREWFEGKTELLLVQEALEGT